MPLTTTQQQSLKADVAAAADPECQALEADPTNADKAFAVAALYNQTASPAFTVWKKSVPILEVGDNLVGTDLAGLSNLNHTRLQTVIILSTGGVNPSLPDRRAFFDDIFSGAGGAATRAKLAVLWRRPATRVQKLFSVGTGSDANPATTAANVTDGFLLSYQDVLAAMQS